jgi:hypothetical protein
MLTSCFQAPDSTKSTADRIKETTTGTVDHIARGAMPDSHKSNTQSVTDRMTHGTGSVLPDSSKTHTSGSILPDSSKTHNTGSILPDSSRTHNTGSILPDTSKTHTTGESILDKTKDVLGLNKH